jgi:hypothetical protein
MAWRSLKDRLNSLPVIIAGPILRRVEKHTASVWIAARQPLSEVVLQVFEPDAADPGKTGALILEGTGNTVAFGANLHIGLITAIVHEGRQLRGGAIYLYDLTFGSLGGKKLASSGVLANDASAFQARFCYAPYRLPSFAFVSDRIEALRLVHGSCRKPHGGKTDALSALDKMLQSNATAAAQRPQMLFLTGDQIYADDVADALLYMLRDAAGALLGWSNAADIYHAEYLNEGLSIPKEFLEAGSRQNWANKQAFSSGEGKSHLFFLGEFYAMYLFAWSDLFWQEDYPGFVDVCPLRHNELLRLSTQINDPLPYAIPFSFRKEVQSLKGFALHLPAVRRALANIPVFMIFDDHEVTDDWFLNLEWTKEVMGMEVPRSENRQIIANGLTAYGLFQAWGNEPEYFSKDKGSELLQSIAALNQDRSSTSWQRVQNIVLPQIEVFVPSVRKSPGQLTGGCKWHFSITYDAFQLIVLDTRTKRGFPSLTAAPALLSKDAMAEQFPVPAEKELTLLVSPAPVVGHYFIEEVLQRTLTFFKAGRQFADAEAWSLNREAVRGLFKKLMPYRRVLILSGDLHYAYSNYVHCWDLREKNAPKFSLIAQMCSSSLKNSDGKTNGVASRVGSSWVLPHVSEYFGWDDERMSYVNTYYYDDVEKRIDYSKEYRIKVNPTLHRMSNIESVNPDYPPSWRHRVQWIVDRRRNIDRGVVQPDEFGPVTAQTVGLQHRRTRQWDAQRVIVGKDNIGLVYFKDWGTAVPKIVQELWYDPKGLPTTPLLPYTVHEVSAVLPDEHTPLPG